MKKVFINRFLLGFVSFCMSAVFLSSCHEDDRMNIDEASGDMVAVSIPIEGVNVESEIVSDSPSSRSGSSDVTITEELEDGFVVETTLVPVSDVHTRGTETSALANDVEILAIVYNEDGSLYKYEYFTPSAPKIHLPQGKKFKIVFYSYNSTTKPEISGAITGKVFKGKLGYYFDKGATLGNIDETPEKNVMWDKVELTDKIVDGVRLPAVRFTHLFSRITWNIVSKVGDIRECQATINNTFSYGRVKLGNLVGVTRGTNNRETWLTDPPYDHSVSVQFPSINATDVTSVPTTFCPRTTEYLNLSLQKLTVGNKVFTDKEFTINGTKMQRGRDYIVRTTFWRRLTVTFGAGIDGTVTNSGPVVLKAYGEKASSTAQVTSNDREFLGWYNGNKKLTSGNGITVDGATLTVEMNDQTEGQQYVAHFGVAGVEWAHSNLYYNNGSYIFRNSTERKFDKNAFFLRTKEKPNDGVAKNMSGSTTVNDGAETTSAKAAWSWDPCSKVTEQGGGWRLPTREENEKFFSVTHGATKTRWRELGYHGSFWQNPNTGEINWNFGCVYTTGCSQMSDHWSIIGAVAAKNTNTVMALRKKDGEAAKIKKNYMVCSYYKSQYAGTTCDNETNYFAVYDVDKALCVETEGCADRHDQHLMLPFPQTKKAYVQFTYHNDNVPVLVRCVRDIK